MQLITKIQKISKIKAAWKKIEDEYIHKDYSIPLQRSLVIQQNYDQFKEKIIKEGKYQTIGQYFKEERLKPIFYQNNQNNIQNNFAILVNDFPYDIQPLQHFVFWVKPGLEHIYTVERARQICEQYFQNVIRLEVFENPTILKSIPEIQHYQIFIQFKDESQIYQEEIEKQMQPKI
ncbi:hypothetical protein PPERSA_00372 [Pseudocohnilembus persalinus]|uniref:Uncharacterized protein n=1 Tax=Pseudocohnilembus persalinus TaxID=266149 RepID=A0A0V0QXZ9_PSEPJ|nr:hypothetical protein PPERSA_00372 [Pseudocohnilembus persalinus]|eukprot:KRX07215.1 hypothetical protein PPERSA_00372 [Pseudocohnilembus persalinus]